MNQPKNSVMLADGTVLENCSCGFAERSLWCWIKGYSMADCFAMFNDPEKTKAITVMFNTTGSIYRGFTDLLLIKKSSDVFGNQTVDLRMSWPEGGEHSIEEITAVKDSSEEEE